jgi:predicted nucleic acid-binding protein
VFCVLDSSAGLTWAFQDEASDATSVLLMAVAGQGAMVPSLWKLEMANGLLVGERRGRISTADRFRIQGLLEQLPITEDDETASLAFSAITALAHHHQLTVYDACYLELALRAGLPLATLDKALRAAAAANGVGLAL